MQLVPALPANEAPHAVEASELIWACESFRPRIWLLLAGRQGDDNQLLALAQALEFPFEAKHLAFNRLSRIKLLRNERLLHLTPAARSSLKPPWPDLVVGVGYEGIAVSRQIRRLSGGRTRVVQLGNPRTRLDDLDLVITTPQYDLADRPNTLKLHFPIGNPARAAAPTDQEERWLRAFPAPRRVVAVGGGTRQWELDISELRRATFHLKGQCERDGGSIIASTSRRTPPEVTRLLKSWLTGATEAVVDPFPRFGVLLARSDEFFVTADSVSMLAEAILTGKPVGMIPIQPSPRARLGRLLGRLGIKLKSHADLARFWRYLDSNNLVGTVDHPLASNVPDTVAPAVQAVRRVLRL